MNDTASKDPAVAAMFAAMEKRNWEDLKTPSGHYGYGTSATDISR